MEQPKRLGDYEVLDKLGSGGMGEVWRVRNVISDRVEAMKVLLPDLVGRQDLASRFLREIKVLAALHHPNIAALRTALTVDNQLVMIMELVEGRSLAHHLAQAPISPSDARQVVLQVLDALEYAHGQQVIHRDIKPANMMVTPQGGVKLTDFGIARSTRDATLTSTGATTGSLSYISPEQINGATPDVRSDLYSLGVSLYEMLAGQVPFKADNDAAVMFAHLQKAPVPPIELQPAISPEMNALVLKAIAKDPAERFQSATEFREALKHVPMTADVSGSKATAPLTPAATAPLPAAALPAAAAPPPIPQIAAMANTPGAHDNPGFHAQPPAGGRPSQPVPPPRRVQGGVGPMIYIALGAFLVVAVVGGLAVYHTIYAEPSPAPLNAVETTPTPPPETKPAPPPETPAATTTPTAPAADPNATAPSSPPPVSPAVSLASVPAAAATAPAPASTKAVAKRDPAPAVPAERSGVTSVRRDDRGGAGETARVAEATKAAEAKLEEALDQLEAELDQLSARVEAVNGTLDRLKAEQARAGYGLRGDMAARQRTLNTNIEKAEAAMDRKDLARAERFKALAQADLEVLEKFIGR